jgi:predicted metallopeptidase
MSIKYKEAEDIKAKVKKIVELLEMNHVNLDRVFCIRSHESSSRNIIARCHTLPKIMQQVLEIEPAYIIEILSEKFDKMPEEEQIKTLIHELLHIPQTFGGGFRHHNFVRSSTIDKFYRQFIKKDQTTSGFKNIEEL